VTESSYPVRVPEGRGPAAAQALSRLRRDQQALDRYVVRFGETLERIAAAHKTTTQKLADLNAIAPGEVLRGGEILLVPHVDAPANGGLAPAGGVAPAGAVSVPSAAAAPARPSVVVPADVFVYPGRRRVFYHVRTGDMLNEIASALQVSIEDLRKWNDLDPAARLQEGMTLQAFVAEEANLSQVVVAPENDVNVLAIGSDEFFGVLEHDRGFRRVTYVAAAGDTIETIGRRHGVPAYTMERINRRSRGDVLKAGESVVVYLPALSGERSANGPRHAVASAAATEARRRSGGDADPQPNGPLPLPPIPDLLP
ncbi:MAG: LysM peptidoglycan-binding domain-containing protein, partial [Polyangiaceae bacterium]|nr:LysM peptidoglycan-binding domain-containing protein [Polyangiaceae bacterium]